jgi:citrate synthase
MARTATLTFDGKTLELPIVVGSEGEVGIDITELRAKTGAITLDPSFGNSGACKSAITFIDGDKGILRYRGIPIEQVAEKSRFIETAYLLIFGHLPTQAEHDRFSKRLTRNAPLHEAFKHHFEGFPVDAPPMAMLSAMLSTLACFETHFLQLDDAEAFEEAAARLISKVRTIAAYSYRRAMGLPFMYPDPNLRYVANFLHMMFSDPYEQYIAPREIEDALNLILVLHADHEQNCSTSTVRAVGSSKANLFASCAAGVCALWGPLHGGANVEVLEMLGNIHRGGLSPQKCIEMAKGFWPPRLQELRPPRQAAQGRQRQGARQAGHSRPPARHRHEAGRTGPEGSVLRGPQALPQRGLLLRHHHEGDRHPGEHVHGDVLHRPAAGLDRPVERAAR